MAKYEKVKGYWVYVIQVPSNGKFYVGVSKQQCCQRWNKTYYKTKSLAPYLNEWDSMTKTVLIDGLTKDEAYKYEGNIIQALSMNDICINSYRSGLIANDINAYYRKYRENNPDYYKQWQKDNREKWNEYQREYQRQQRLKKKLEQQQNQQLN